MYLCKKYKYIIMNKTTQNKKSVTWQYKGKKDLVIPVNLSPYEALRMVGVPFNPYTQSGFIRPQNASYGVKNSFHKRPWKGSKKYGSAVDLTPAPGYTYDDILRALAHPALQAWAKANGYGILDERPASVRKRTNATGPHLHFGPDKGATKIYANPLIAPHYSYWKSLGMKTPKYNGAEVKYDNIRGNINTNTPVTVSNNSIQYLPLELIQTPLLQPVYIPAQQQVNGFDLTYSNYDWSNLFDSAPQKSNLLEHVLPQYNYEYSNNINLLAPFLFSDIQRNSSISEPEEKKLKIRFAADGGFINTFKDGGKPVSFNSIADMIKAHEGFRATPYKDGRNKKTGEQWYSVGYGFNDSGIHHNIGKKYIGKQMTRKEADNLLQGYITHLQGTLKKTLGDKIYNSLTPGQMMAYIDTGYQRPATMINAAKLHRKTGNINNVANALAVKGYDKRNANRRNAFLGNISINQQNIPEYQEVIQPVQIPQIQQDIYQQPSVLTSVNIPESSIVEDYNYLNNDEYIEDMQKPNMAIVSANPELYGEQFNNAEFLKAMFEPLGVNNNQIKNVENKKLRFKHISAEGGALVIDNDNDLVDNQDWDSYIKQKFSEYEDYQIVPDLTEEEIQRESNGIPLYANGGEVNIFDGYGSSYIPRGMREVGKADDGTFIYTATPDIMKQYYPDLFNLAPSNQGYMFLGKGDGNYTPMRSSEHKYDKFIDYDKLGGAQNYADDTETYINLPEIEVTPQSSTIIYPELSTYNNSAPVANPYNRNDITLQETLQNQFNQSKDYKEQKDKATSRYIRQILPTNEEWAEFLTNAALTGLGGAALWKAPLHFALGMLGMEAGNNYIDWLVKNSTDPYNSWEEMMHEKYGLPEFAAYLSNPGGWIGGTAAGFGIRNPKLDISGFDIYDAGKQGFKQIKENGIQDVYDNVINKYNDIIDGLRNYSIKAGLPDSKYAQTIKNNYPQFSEILPDEYVEAAKRGLNVGPQLGRQYELDYNTNGNNIFNKTLGKKLKDATELIFHGNINKIKNVREKLRQVEKSAIDIDNNIDNAIGAVQDYQFDQRQAQADYFKANPYFDMIKLSDLSNSDINAAIITETNRSNYPYDITYQNGQFTFTPKNGNTTGETAFKIPEFGTNNWIEGTVPEMSYYGQGNEPIKTVDILQSPSQGADAYKLGASQNYINDVAKQFFTTTDTEPLLIFEGNGSNRMSLFANPEYNVNSIAPKNKNNVIKDAPELPESAKQVTKKNVDYIEQQELPGFKAYGSAKTSVEGAVAKAAGDIDGYMAKSDFDKLSKDKKSRMTTVNGLTYQYQVDPTGQRKYALKDKNGNIIKDKKGKAKDWGVIDINVVEVDPKGYGNKRAEQIFRQFFPEEYHKAVVESMSNPKHNGKIPIVDKNGIPITDKQLVEAYDPLTGSIIDATEANFLDDPTNKGKHAGRWFNYLIGNRPDAISNALSKATKMMYGQNGTKLPKMKFGTVEENKQLLLDLGYPEEAANIIAKDPAKMQNAMDYWYIVDRGTYRIVDPDGRGSTIGTPQTITRNLTQWNISANGGTGAGGGLNTVMGGNSQHFGKVVGRSQPKIIGIKDGMTPQEIIKEVDYQMGVSPIEQRDIDVLNAMGIRHNLQVGDPVQKLHSTLSPRGVDWGWDPGDEAIYNEFLSKSGRRGIKGYNYGQGDYWGSGPIDPINDALGINSAKSSAYDVMSIKNRKQFIENQNSRNTNVAGKASDIIREAGRNKVQQNYDAAIQEFRKNSVEYQKIQKRIDNINEELNKLDRQQKSNQKGYSRYSELEQKLYKARAKRYDILKATAYGSLISSLFGGAVGIYKGMHTDEKENRYELQKVIRKFNNRKNLKTFTTKDQILLEKMQKLDENNVYIHPNDIRRMSMHEVDEIIKSYQDQIKNIQQ